jgi:predicted nucleic acid-binding protein
MANARQRLCVDASVGAKWLFRDEEDRPAVVSLLDRYAAGEVDLVVPDLFFCEVSNAVLVAVRRKRISGEAALEALRELKDLHLAPVSVGPLLESAFSLALRLGLSVYDAAYLAVSESQGVPLVTADRRLLDCDLEWVVSLDSL